MSDVQTLTERARVLSQSVDWWNTAVIFALVCAALAAIAVVVTTRVAFVRAKALTDTQAKLLQVKEAQLTIDLKDKDLKIADAGGKAATAERIADGFRLEIANANERAAQANRIAEEERLARIRIEEKMAPRRLSPAQRDQIARKLNSFAGQKVNLLAYGGDAESIGFANDIIATFSAAGWTVNATNEIPSTRAIAGVLVELRPDADDASRLAAIAVVRAFCDERVDIKGPAPPYAGARLTSGPSLDFKLPLTLTVGRK